MECVVNRANVFQGWMQRLKTSNTLKGNWDSVEIVILITRTKSV